MWSWSRLLWDDRLLLRCIRRLLCPRCYSSGCFLSRGPDEDGAKHGRAFQRIYVKRRLLKKPLLETLLRWIIVFDGWNIDCWETIEKEAEKLRFQCNKLWFQDNQPQQSKAFDVPDNPNPQTTSPLSPLPKHNQIVFEIFSCFILFRLIQFHILFWNFTKISLSIDLDVECSRAVRSKLLKKRRFCDASL
jgi:hypothetical protein